MDRKSALTRILVVIFISLITSSTFATQPTHASSKTIVVPDDYPTINAAIENAANGDTIFVKKGIYNEVLVIDKAVSLMGEDKETTVINGSNTATVILIRHDNVEVSGFSVVYDETPNSPDYIWMWGSRLIGIHLLSVKNCSIFGNKISDCGAGIWLYDSHQNSVTGNYVFRNDYGVRVEVSNENNITGNAVTGNWGGIWLLSASYNKFRENTMANNAQNFAISGYEPSEYANDFDQSNTVDGKPIYYWIDVSDRTIPSDAGCVVLVNCMSVNVQGLNLANNQYGILLAFSHSSIVTNNSIVETGAGVGIYGSHNDSIVGNNINSNVGINSGGNGTRIANNIIKAGSTGINVDGCYQTITDNTVEAGTFGSGNEIIYLEGSYNTILHNKLTGQTAGIVFEGSYNSFYENIVTNGEQMRVEGDWNIIAKNKLTASGITVRSGSNNVVCANTIVYGLGLGIGGHNNLYYANHMENNYYVGAVVIGTEVVSSSNTVYHNNFVNNEQQVQKWGATPQNFWDNGSEGNYWSDYNGFDLNMDGIGETPYLIKGEVLNESLGRVVEVVSGQDNYPLMEPFDISSVDVELPEWEYTAPPITPLPSPEPTPYTSPSPTPTPSQDPTPAPEQQPEPFPTTLVIAASGVSLSAIGVVLLTYFKKHKH